MRRRVLGLLTVLSLLLCDVLDATAAGLHGSPGDFARPE